MSVLRRSAFVVLLGVVLALTLGVLTASAAVVLADSYSETNADATWPVYGTQPEAGQSFAAVSGSLDSATFLMSNDNAVTSGIRAYVYAHTGAYGTDGLPTGMPLAVSAPVDFSTVGLANEIVTFNFDNTVTLISGQHYVITVRHDGAWPNPIYLRMDTSTPTHPGYMVNWSGATWVGMGYDVVFSVHQIPPTPLPVYRFYRASSGTHFYTADPDEMARVRDTMAAIYHLDGVGYQINTSSPVNSAPLYRFYNQRTGTHLYTADEVEKSNILANLSASYLLEGAAYNVSRTSGTPVVRFYSPSRGVHFYSADPDEIAYVRADLGAMWQYEGIAYYVMQ